MDSYKTLNEPQAGACASLIILYFIKNELLKSGLNSGLLSPEPQTYFALNYLKLTFQISEIGPL